MAGSGSDFTSDKRKGHWVRTLDGRRASEMYANLFGYKPREWTYPPLIQLVRLYPFGLEQDGDSGQESAQYLVRSLLCVEAEGSLRMNRVIQEESTAHLLIGSPENCLSAAKRVTQLALDTLGSAKPILALIYADVAWQMLLEANPGSDAHAVRTVLGPDVPPGWGVHFWTNCPRSANRYPGITKPTYRDSGFRRRIEGVFYDAS